MKLLCLSNGHGEDGIGASIAQALQQQPQAPALAALPIVGEGRAYERAQIPLIGPTQTMPSGGFIYMDGGKQLARDVQGGLISLTVAQLKAVRTWAKAGGYILAVGDIVPLLIAWSSGAPYAFVGTAKSEYYLRDETGPYRRTTWFEQLETWAGSVYLPWERWLMGNARCRAVFPRDSLTAQFLKKWPLPVQDLGNPMMDGLASAEQSLQIAALTDPHQPLTILLLPGSRVPEAYDNWGVILSAIAPLLRSLQPRPLKFLGAIAPGLDLAPLTQQLGACGWTAYGLGSPESELLESDKADDGLDPPALQQFLYPDSQVELVLTQTTYADCLNRADLAIAMAGTATEQFVGLGKPVITISGDGPQFTPAFAEAQSRHLGPSVTWVQEPDAVSQAVQALLQDPGRLQQIVLNGRQRMGSPGAAARIAAALMDCMNAEMV